MTPNLDRLDLGTFGDRTIAVLGLGVSGLSAAGELRRAGARVLPWDDNENRRNGAAARGLTPCDLTTAAFDDIDMLVLSPGIPQGYPHTHPVVARARAADCEILCDIELLTRAAPDARYIGITGTNGKSTTTALIGHVLSRLGLTSDIGGNIGAPALSLRAVGADGIYVLELSSYQLDLLPRAVFDVAVLLNITPDHLDRHGGMDGYVAAKKRIFDGQDSTQNAIIGIDDDHSRSIFDEVAARGRPAMTPISVREACPGGIYLNDGWIVDDRDGDAARVLEMRELPALPGTHNAQNVATAYGAVTAIIGDTNGHRHAEIVAAITAFPGLVHRQELLGTIGAISFVNDSKATNAEATAHALAAYENIYWIAGGIAKDGGIASLAPMFGRVKHAFLIGEAAEDFADMLHDRVPAARSGDLATATRQAAEMAAGDEPAVVLLSPACASFDQFASFEARGEAFRATVAAMPGFVPHPAEGTA